MLRGNMTSSSSASNASLRGQHRRGLNLPGLVGLTFFCVAGGAYGLEDGVGAGGPLMVLLGIAILPWLWSLPTALMTVELSTAMPEDGGYVVWVEKAFGRFWGFQEGWLSWLCSFADNALYPVMFVDYLAYLRGDMAPLERWLIATALICVITWLNIRGTHLVGLSSIVFTALVLAPFAVMLVLGLPQVSPANWLQRTATTDWPLLISILLWNTSGWDNAGCCAGAVDAPNRVYPRAMTITLILVTATYLLPLAVGTGVDSDWTQWREGYLPKIAARIGGSWLGIWLSAAALVSAAGMFSALLCTSARVPFAMARRSMLPRALAVSHRRYDTPWRAILINSAGVALLMPFSFQELIEVDMFLYAAALILEFAALIWLRIKRPEMPRPYRIPCGTSGVIAFCIPPIALCLLSIALSNPATKYLGLASIVVGLAVYRWQTRTVATGEIEIAPIA